MVHNELGERLWERQIVESTGVMLGCMDERRTTDIICSPLIPLTPSDWRLPSISTSIAENLNVRLTSKATPNDFNRPVRRQCSESFMYPKDHPKLVMFLCQADPQARKFQSRYNLRIHKHTTIARNRNARVLTQNGCIDC